MAKCSVCGQKAGFMMNMCDACIGKERGRIQSEAEIKAAKQVKAPTKPSTFSNLLRWKELDRYERNALKSNLTRWLSLTMMLGVPALLLYSCFDAVYNAEPKDASVLTDDAVAVVQCQDIVRMSATYGSKADFSIWRDVRRSGDSTYVNGKVEFMNGFGAMIPYTYHCRFSGNALTDSNVVPD